jgi:hypothetical protein
MSIHLMLFHLTMFCLKQRSPNSSSTNLTYSNLTRVTDQELANYLTPAVGCWDQSTRWGPNKN